MKFAGLVLLSLLTAAGAAMAQPQAPPGLRAAFQAMRQACAADMKTLCAGAQGREAVMCLRRNRDKASVGCRGAMARLPARGPAGAPRPGIAR